MSRSQALLWMFAACILSTSVTAAPLVYAPVNPDFGGNPGNAGGLLAEAAIEKPSQKIPASAGSSSGSASAIAEQLKNNILANISSTVASEIVGVDSVASGTESLGGGASISWNRVGGTVNVTIIGTDGSTTTFGVPVI